MIGVRWRKLGRDLRAAWGRVLIMQLAIAVALTGVGVTLGTRAVLQREIRASYLGTEPADATLELRGPVDDAVLAAVRARPEIAAADRRQMIRARVRARPDAPWQSLVLFVADDFTALRLNRFRPERGPWPPPPGAILVERTAVAVMDLDGGPHGGGHRRPGGHGAMMAALRGGPRVTVQTPHGPPRELTIAGTVHDPGQAPSWQEHRGCAYATPATLALLGEDAALHELLVRFQPAPRSVAEVERAAAALADALRADGHDVVEVRVPKLRQHPHQGLMNAVQLVLLTFSLLLLVLSAIVVATMLSAILARQVREIGVMKAVGARTGQLAGLYAAFVAGLGAIAALVAIPLGAAGTHALVGRIAAMMNLAVTDPRIPAWVFGALAGLGVLVPLAIAALPIGAATRITVRRALAHHGAGGDFARPWMARLPPALRQPLRRPARLAATMALLVIGGALVVTAAGVERGLRGIATKLAEARHHDVEVRLRDPVAPDRLADLAALPGVRVVEAWSATEAAIARPGQVAGIVHTYPDGGHGSTMVVAAPAGGSALVDYPLLAGRRLGPDDVDAVVLGHNAARGVPIGAPVAITVEGVTTSWTVVGRVEEIGGGSAFVTAAGYQRATGAGGVAVLRIATTARDPGERAATVAAIERALGERGLAVQYAMPTPLLRSIIDDHVALVVRAVLVMAALLAAVGLIGLGAATAIGVAERTRELGVLKVIGASGGRILGLVIAEAVATGAVSAALAIGLGLPLTALVDARIAAAGFLAAPPFAIAPAALIAVPLALVAGSALAAAIPARRAARLSVRAALAEV